MKNSLRPRLRAAQEAAAFTTTDMAHWFDVKRTTMSHWLRGHAKPYPFVALLLQEPLELLERACRSPKFAKKLPVPLAVSLDRRYHFIEQLKANATKIFSKSHSGGQRRSVRHKDKQA